MTTDTERLRELLAKASIAEIVDDAGWSLSLCFGKDCDGMRELSDNLRALPDEIDRLRAELSKERHAHNKTQFDLAQTQVKAEKMVEAVNSADLLSTTLLPGLRIVSLEYSNNADGLHAYEALTEWSTK